MQIKTWRQVGLFKLCIGSTVGMLLVPFSTASGQTHVSLQSLQPVPQLPPPALVSLPTTPVSEAGSVTEAETPVPTDPVTKPWLLRELPQVQDARGKTPMVVAEVALHSSVAPASQSANSPQVVTVVSLSALQQQSANKAEKPGLDKYFDLSVEDLTKRSKDPQTVLANSHIERKYFESALVADPTRLQSPEIGPYLWSSHAYCWESPTFCFSPLYFEQPNLERYGQGVGRPFESTTSAVKFVTDVTTLPIALVCTPPWSSSCSLGHHRPGDCAPYQRKTGDH